jgi:hypothetical protein
MNKEIYWSDAFKVVEQMERDTGKDYSDLRIMLAEAVLREARANGEEPDNDF